MMLIHVHLLYFLDNPNLHYKGQNLLKIAGPNVSGLQGVYVDKTATVEQCYLMYYLLTCEY